MTLTCVLQLVQSWYSVLARASNCDTNFQRIFLRCLNILVLLMITVFEPCEVYKPPWQDDLIPASGTSFQRLFLFCLNIPVGLKISVWTLRNTQNLRDKQFLMLNLAKTRYSKGGNGCPVNIKTRFGHLKHRYGIYVALKLYVRCSNLEAEINVVPHARKEDWSADTAINK